MKDKMIINDIGRLCITSIAYLSAIIKSSQERFKADDIAKTVGLKGKDLGGGWTALTIETKNRPPFLCKMGTFTRRNKEGRSTGVGSYWIKNKDIDWVEAEKVINAILGDDTPLEIIKLISQENENKRSNKESKVL